MGEISDAPQVNLNVSPEWLQIRAVIVTALDSHPEAKNSVLSALDGVDSG